MDRHPNDLRSLSMGLKCWPQWQGWLICMQTGDLVDPEGQQYGPGLIMGARWISVLNELRDRVIFADSPVIVPALRCADMLDREDDGTLRAGRELRRRADAAFLRLRTGQQKSDNSR